MRFLSLSLQCCVAVSLLAVAGSLCADSGEAEIICTFEDAPGSNTAEIAGLTGAGLPLNAESQTTDMEVRFGNGSLRIGRSQYTPAAAIVPLRGSELQAFGGEVSRLSIAGWVKSPETGRSFGIAMRRPADGGAGNWSLSFTGYKTLYFRVMNDNGLQECHSKALSMMEPEQWIHLAMTYDEGEVRFYVNGEPLGEPHHMDGTRIPACDTHTTTLAFFRDSFEGMLVDDLICTYRRLLSAEEIATLHAEGAQQLVEKVSTGGKADAY